MSRRLRKRKPLPRRTCVACRDVRPKRELVRIVRAPEGGVAVDETGKRSGRGAYLCQRPGCWESALSKGQLDRALRTELTEEETARLREYGRSLEGDQGSDEEGGSV
ncbi:MAG: YlxR family protein [Anaerolineae bacterium]